MSISIKVFGLLLIAMGTVFTVVGQISINPGRPSFSENTHIVPVFHLQGEQGLLLEEHPESYNYSFGGYYRMGFHSRLEGRIFSGVESIQIKHQDQYSALSSQGYGIGVKYFASKEKAIGPALAFLVQSTFNNSSSSYEHAFNVLLSKEVAFLSFDGNINTTFVGNQIESMQYIICANYQTGKTAFFLEGIYTKGFNISDEILMQAGAAFNFNDFWQVDVAVGSYAPAWTNQVLQVGFSFLTGGIK